MLSLARTASAVTLAAVTACAHAAAPTPGFHFIGTLGGPGQEVMVPMAAGAGGVVVGYDEYARSDGLRRGFVWTPSDGLRPLSTRSASEGPAAYGVSRDGRTMLLADVRGVYLSGPTSARTPLALARGMTDPRPQALGADASAAVGIVSVGAEDRAVRWTAGGSVEELPPLTGHPSAQALGVSGDGVVAVGVSGPGYPGAVMPVRWAGGQVKPLGLPGDCSWAWARACSGDGEIVVGFGWTPSTSRAFVWSSADGMRLLPPLPGDDFAEAWSISADGRLIGGRSGVRSVVWKDGVPFEVQRELIGDASIAPLASLSGNAIISADGRTIASSEPLEERADDADYAAWAVVLPSWFVPGPACAGDYDASGRVDLGDIFAFLNDWFAGESGADFNGRAGVEVLDIFAFLNAWYDGGC